MTIFQGKLFSSGAIPALGNGGVATGAGVGSGVGVTVGSTTGAGVGAGVF